MGKLPETVDLARPETEFLRRTMFCGTTLRPALAFGRALQAAQLRSHHGA